MDRAVMEIIAIEEVVKNANDDTLRELNDLQLAFVGGGAADPIFA